jgi:predicted metal-binding membrane protein
VSSPLTEGLGLRSATMSEVTTLEAVLKRDRAIVLAGVAGLLALAWAYLLALAWGTPHQARAMAMAMPHMHA